MRMIALIGLGQFYAPSAQIDCDADPIAHER